MSLVDNLIELLDPAIKRAGFILEEIKVTPVGRRRIIAVIVDRLDRNPNLDEVTVVSRSVAEILEGYSQLGDTPYTLEVTTPGVDRPLREPHHWRKNIGRLVKVELNPSGNVTGRIKAVNDERVAIETNGNSVEIEFSQVKRAQVEIEFNRKEV